MGTQYGDHSSVLSCNSHTCAILFTYVWSLLIRFFNIRCDLELLKIYLSSIAPGFKTNHNIIDIMSK